MKKIEEYSKIIFYTENC